MESATKAPLGVRPADKVLQALSTLAALIDSTIREVKSLDNEFQSRLLQAVHDTEASLQEQTAQHVERARQEVQEELNVRLQNEFQTTVNGLKSEFDTEREHFNNELRQAGETASKLESEKSGLIAEVQQVKADFAAEIEKAREELKNAVHKTEVLLQAETAESVERARQTVQEELNSQHQKDLQAALDGLKAEFEIERGRLIAQIQQVETGSATEIENARESAKKAVHDTEAALQAQAAENVERARQEVQNELNSKHQKDLQAALDGLKSEFETERAGLIEQLQQVKAGSATELENALESAKKAVHDTEASLQAQAAENVERERQKVQDELNSKHQKDLQAALDSLKSEFEIERGRLIAEIQQVTAGSTAEIENARESVKKAVQDAEASLQAQAAENIERARQAVQDELNSKYRKDLQAAQEGLKSEFEIDRERLNKELHHTVEVASKLESERTALLAQLQQVKADSAAEIEKARAQAKAAPAKQPGTVAAAPPASLQQEIARADSKLQEILKLIDNPATELSKVIRLNVEKSELEAYLKGIRLVLDTKS